MIRVDMTSTWWENWGGWIIGALVGIVSLVLIIATCGLAAVAAAAVTGITASVSIGVGTILTATAAGTIAGVWYSKEALPEDLYLPEYSISAEEIFKGDILLFNVDFFSPEKEIYLKTAGNYKDGDDIKTDESKVRDIPLSQYKNKSEELNKIIKDEGVKEYFYKDGENEIVTSRQNTAYEIQGVVSKWYNSIRNIAVVLMMSVLLYIGIRMMLSTVASDKAKYKQMLMDWLVGMCLLFFMHYIMAFSVMFTKEFTKVIDSAYDDPKAQHVILENDEDDEIKNKLTEMGMEDLIVESGNSTYIDWPTNLMGKMRLQLQLTAGTTQFIGYGICFMILVMYTIFFAFTYLKRVIYLAFLTIIAPLVALTYPIDKLNDGQAQGFNKWLKEYIFNLLIQPLHLLLYTMLVSSAFEFAGINVWYMLVAIGFLIPAEKLLRSFFGFEKATTPGSFAGAAVGAGLVSRGIGGLLHKMPMPGGPGKPGLGKGGNGDKDGLEGKAPKTRFKADEFNAANAIMGGTALMGNASTPNKEKEDEGILERYRAEGFGKNANGEYFNPYTSEYDANYSPLKDSSYRGLDTSEEENNYSPLKDGSYRELEIPKDENNEKLNIPENNKNELDNNLNNDNKIRNANKEMPKPKRKIKRVARAAAVGTKKLVGKGVRNGAVFAANKIRTAPNAVGKVAVGATLGAIAGTAGVAAGIASGDISNAVQYGMAGAGAGAVTGAKLAESAENRFQGSGQHEIMNAMKESYYGEEEYQEKQKDKQIKQMMRNQEMKQQLRDKVGEKTAKEMYKNGDVENLLRLGISDTTDMAAIHKLQEEKVVDSFDQAVGVHKYAQRMGDTTKMKKKDRDEWNNTLSDEFQKVGYDKDSSKKGSDKTIGMVDKYYKMRKDM